MQLKNKKEKAKKYLILTKTYLNPKNQFTSPIRELDEFRLVDVDSDSIVIGARNHVFQLSKTSLTPHNTIEWSAPAQVAEECSMKGRPTSDCHNFIRVVARRRNGHLLVCGTHAFSPQCREYEFLRSENRYKSSRDFNGRAITPYDPRANFTYVYSPESNEIFVATVSDFNGNDPLIYKKKIPTGDGIRTQKDDLRVLDHPDFISSFSYKDFYYVWFRERASESSEEQIFSRVGRVCRNDNGGPSTTQDRWSSFLKARLNCSIAADVPFYFNELQSISEPIPQSDGDAIVYAVFSTSRSAVLMNAVCAFKMSTIDRVFNHGNFKTQRSVSSYSSQKSQNLRGVERPGKCPKDSRSLGDISFILKNPLMSDLINAIDQPLLVEGPSKPDLTKVIAIGGVKAVERNQTYDIIYVGRNDGKVIKLIKAPQGDSVLIESVAVFDNPPTGIQALRPLFESNEMVVVGTDRVAKIPLYHCPSKPDLTKVIAIGGVKAVERNQTYDIIYVGRNDGKVIKLIKAPQGDSVLIESVAVFDNPPTGIQALRPLFESNEMVVVGTDRVAKIPLYHCDKQTSCSRCVALRDPHCAWDTENLVCIHSNDWNFGSFVQNIVKGISSQCPESAVGDIEGYAINASPVMDSTKEFRQLLDEAEDDGFSVTTIAMIIICAVLMATGLGFLVRFIIITIASF
uniref:Sema domain-containing protein n=1 Tax=Panagrolaimus sp. ES5 TaxID=591445 RepID=A0AC34FQF5_9BILA